MYVIIEIIQLIFYLVYCYIEAVIRWFVPPGKKSFAGKLVLITGAGHGIGRELALQFNALGAKLVLWDINKDNNERVAAEIREDGGEATAYQCDVTKLDDIKQIAEDIRCNIGDVDILVNNAGVLNGGALLQLSDKDIRRTMDVNIMAHFWTCREFLPAMMKRNEGHIINIASMAGKGGVAYLVDYSASKFAVIGLTESIATEMERLGKDGIHLTVACPLFVDTGLTKHPCDRFGKILSPAEVATAVIEGAAMNKSCVYVPAAIETQLRFALMFPKKFIRRMTEFLDLGINPQYGEKQE